MGAGCTSPVKNVGHPCVVIRSPSPHVSAETSKTSSRQVHSEASSRPQSSHKLSPHSINTKPPPSDTEVVVGRIATPATPVKPVSDDSESPASAQPETQLIPQQLQNAPGGSVTDASSTGRSAGDSTAGSGSRSAVAQPLMATMQEFPLDYRQTLTGRIADLPLLAEDKVVYVYHIAPFTDSLMERRLFEERVYPVLRTHCAAHGCQLRVLDLSRGLRDEFACRQELVRLRQRLQANFRNQRTPCIFTVSTL
ncbi:hypothetical protein NP493_403g03022 [Ridgeia piscesae]|uniref:Uncharacterized protein n=1 Tax=Ridgeia piscesae TaxID=27915 RepID=A0AAD9NUN5_RIDPI|nr:hypothetical protein NP493_403g03022 [Ridgeia piscesae]